MPATKKASVKKAPLPKKPAAKTPAKKNAPTGDLLVATFASPREWADWLSTHHASARGVWVKHAKKASGIPSITYAEALDEALAWGWIDGQKLPFDDVYYLQKFTPRGPRSLWSKVNRDKIQALTEAGRMRPPGLEQVERAKQDGRWDAAYDSPSRATVPEDLAAALAKNPRAAAFFATLTGANRYAVLFRIHTAKKAETRARRIAQFVEMLARHEKLHP